MGLPRKFNTRRKCGGLWKRLVYSWLPRLLRNLGEATGAVTLYDGPRTCQFWPEQSRLYCPNGPRFPLDAVRMASSNFSICCSNRLGWYWGRQRTSWIRKTVMVFRCRKNFVREIFAVTDNREKFLTAKISRYTVVQSSE